VFVGSISSTGVAASEHLPVGGNTGRRLPPTPYASFRLHGDQAVHEKVETARQVVGNAESCAGDELPAPLRHQLNGGRPLSGGAGASRRRGIAVACADFASRISTPRFHSVNWFTDSASAGSQNAAVGNHRCLVFLVLQGRAASSPNAQAIQNRSKSDAWLPA